MTTRDPVRPVRISGAAGLISAVPVLLGFHPAESLVVLGMRGRRRRLGPAIRIDLPAPDDLLPVVEYLADHAERQADRVAVFCYSESCPCPGGPRVAPRRLPRPHLGVLDAILVRSDHAEFLPDDNGVTERADPAARRRRPHPTGPDRGRRAGRTPDPAQPRGTHPRAWPHRPGPRRSRPKAAVQRAAAVLGKDLVDAVDRAGVLRRAAERALQAAADEHRSTHRVSIGTAARLTLTVCDRWARDALVARVVGSTPEDWVPVLLDAVGRVPADVSADLCSLLAVAAYRSGDGALTQVTLDRCLGAEPHHRFGRMLQEMLLSGLAPEELEDLASPLPAVAQPPSEIQRTLAAINRAAGGSLRPRPASRPAIPVSSVGWARLTASRNMTARRNTCDQSGRSAYRVSRAVSAPPQVTASTTTTAVAQLAGRQYGVMSMTAGGAEPANSTLPNRSPCTNWAGAATGRRPAARSAYSRAPCPSPSRSSSRVLAPGQPVRPAVQVGPAVEQPRSRHAGHGPVQRVAGLDDVVVPRRRPARDEPLRRPARDHPAPVGGPHRPGHPDAVDPQLLHRPGQPGRLGGVLDRA